MSCNGCGQPANGMYVSKNDFQQYQDYFSGIMALQPGYSEACKGCDGCSRKTMVQNITFVVTEQCNLACTYCYEKHKTKNRMTKEVGKAAVDFLFDQEKIKGYFSKEESPAVVLDFIGGEPLLEMELIDYIVEYFKFKAFECDHPWATNYMVSITTNGVLYQTKAVRDFLKKNPRKVSMAITIDGNKDLHDACRVFPNGKGSYDIVERSVKEWIETQDKPQTKITLAPENIMHTFQAHKDLWNLGLKGTNTNCVFEEGWTVDHAKILYSEMKKLGDYLLDNELYKMYYTSLFDDSIGQELEDTRNWCGGSGEMIAIGPDGRVYPCLRYMKYSLATPGRQEKSIGDIYNGVNVDDPWLVDLQKIDLITQSPPQCLECKVPSGCALCTAFHYDKFGDPNKRATYICIMHKARVLACSYYFNKLYKKLGVTNHFAINLPKELALEIIDEDEYLMLLSL